MPKQNTKILSVIDKLIYFFSVLFLLSITNSIFVNQIGYYMTLIFIVARCIITRENVFSKTGLETALLVYILAEILATVFSIEPAHSFRNLMKRFFLIPIIYTFVYSAKDFERAKMFTYIYLGAALITMLIYLGMSYNYFINNFYQLYESGPSTFQYPITSGELMSFSLIFIFAFLAKEKMSMRYKAGVFVLFIINLLALFATYKRTGWMGAAAGVLFVIFLDRRWRLVIPVLLLIIAASFIERNISKIFIYIPDGERTTQKTEFNTDGRAYSIWSDKNSFVVSDFENGLIRLRDNKIIMKYDLGSPVVDFKKWNDGIYVASLIDTRFILLKDLEGKLEKINEFITPGFLTGWCIANGSLYAIDSDSGLTVFTNPSDPGEKMRITEKIGDENEKIFADSLYLVLFSKTKRLRMFPLKNSLPVNPVIDETLTNKSDLIYYSRGKLILSDEGGLKLYSINGDSLKLVDTKQNIRNAVNSYESGNRLFITDTRGNVLNLEFPLKDKIKLISTINLGFIPKSISFDGIHLYASLVKRSRLLSAFDPYIPSNFSRLALWRAGFLILKDHPLVGVGDIDLAGLYKQYKRNYDKEIQGHLHNNYIHVLATLGIVGFLAVMFLLIKVFILYIKNFMMLRNEPFAASFALGASGSYLAFLISGLTEWNFGDHEIITMVWFMLAISIAFVNGIKKKLLS